MVSTDVRSEILRRLRAAEEEHGVRVLLAVESGSRAWGFESPDSDYDARFIYVHPAPWYLSVDLEERRDVIEYPIVDDIDLNGWDLRKALRLFSKSNPTFVEWIQSPILYRENEVFARRVKELLPSIYSCERGILHYRSMALTNFRGYLQGELVPLKKYFYVLRPLLSIRWIERYRSPAPMRFASLLPLIADDVQLSRAIDELLETKRSTLEMGLGPRVSHVHAFIKEELKRLDSIVFEPTPSPGSMDVLNALFHEVLRGGD